MARRKRKTTKRRKRKTTRKRKCKFGVNKNTGACLKNKRQKKR